MAASGKDRGFYVGGRLGPWLGLLLSLWVTAHAFLRSGADQGRTGRHWLALGIAGPILAAGGWVIGKFAGAYVGELCYSGRREQLGFLAGGLLGLLVAGLLARATESSAGPALGLLGLGIGAGIGRGLAQPRP
ncbi:MAG: hypothetical protein NTY77_19555 [Elusimicrobia bacterium]|nr:hypothetical protein [Elusimicrobiota bacterium]